MHRTMLRRAILSYSPDICMLPIIEITPSPENTAARFDDLSPYFDDYWNNLKFTSYSLHHILYFGTLTI